MALFKRPRPIMAFLHGGVLLLLAAGATAPAWRGPCGLTTDSVKYLDAARAMREGGGWTAQTAVLPPIQPAIISIAAALGVPPLHVFPCFGAACQAVAALLTWRLARYRVCGAAAWLAGAIVAVSPVLSEQGLFIRGEPLFAVWLLLAALAAEHIRAASDRPARGRMHVLLGLLIAAATLTRAMGVVLAPALAWAVWPREGSMRRRIGPIALLLAGFALPLSAWNFIRPPAPQSSGYLEELTRPRGAESPACGPAALIAQRAVEFGTIRLRELKQFVIGPHVGWRLLQAPLDRPSTWLLGLPLAAIVAGQALRRRPPEASAAAGLLALLAIWPWDEAGRLSAPLLPLVVVSVLAFVGGRRAPEDANVASDMNWTDFEIRRPPRTSTAATLLAALWLAVTAADQSIVRRQWPARRERFAARQESAANLAQWLEQHVPTDSNWLARAAKGDDVRTTLALAAHLARRPVQIQDCAAGPEAGGAADSDRPTIQVDSTFVAHAHPAPARHVVLPQGASSSCRLGLNREPLAVIDRFEVYEPAEVAPAGSVW